MDISNFWGFLIDGLGQVLQFVIEQMPLPFADFQQLLSGLPTMLYFGISPMLVFVGPFINLQIFMSVVISIMVLEGARAIVGVWRLILRVIPAAG